MPRVGAAWESLAAAPASFSGVDRALPFSLFSCLTRTLALGSKIRNRAILIGALVAYGVAIAQAAHAGDSAAGSHTFYIDCSAGANSGNGTSDHPWNMLAAAQAHTFAPGDQVALRRGTECHGAFAPLGSGTDAAPIRLTAFGEGPRPRIVASSADRQALLLSNQEYWQVDSLDFSGGSTYGIYVTGDHGLLHHIYLKNLAVHDVRGGDLKNKDNGLVVIGPSKLGAYFDDVLVDGVDAAHSNQWAGILVGGGPFYIPDGAYLSQHVIIRNSTVHDVYGDGIVLFRDVQSAIRTSAAWETGMQPTQTVGTPNAIWTWTCTDCVVEDNEAFLTDSPGVDGGAYDIDWANTRNVVQRNFAHDTEGYCVAVFAAGYVTSNSVVRNNLCADNARSPRLAALQGAVYLSTWNGGVIRDLRIEGNTIIWNPTVSSAAAIVDIATTDKDPIVFTGNRVEASAPFIYRTDSHFAPSKNVYQTNPHDAARFTIGAQTNVPLGVLQPSGIEAGSKLAELTAHSAPVNLLHLEATVDLALDGDGLLAPGPRAQLVVLRSLARQYGVDSLSVTVHLRKHEDSAKVRVEDANALLDLDAAPIHFDDDAHGEDSIRLLSSDGRVLGSWTGFQNAATLGGRVRALLGPPHYSQLAETLPVKETR